MARIRISFLFIVCGFSHSTAIEISPLVSAFSTSFTKSIIVFDLMDMFDYRPLNPREIATAFYYSIQAVHQRINVPLTKEPQIAYDAVIDTSRYMTDRMWTLVYGNTAGKVLESDGRLEAFNQDRLPSEYVKTLRDGVEKMSVRGDPKERVSVLVEGFIRFLHTQGLYSGNTSLQIIDLFRQELFSVSRAPEPA